MKESALAKKYLDGLVGIQISADDSHGSKLKDLNSTSDLNDYKVSQLDNTFSSPIVFIDFLTEKLPYADDELDFVIASHAIEHFIDPIKMINECLRVVKKYVFIHVIQKEKRFDSQENLTSPEKWSLKYDGKLTHDRLDESKSEYVTHDKKPVNYRIFSDIESFIDLCHQQEWNITEVDNEQEDGFMILLSKKISVERTLSPRKTNPYYILAPDYTDTSSGVRTLHMLCHAINLSGLECYVTSDFFNLKQENIRLNSESNGEKIQLSDSLNTPILTSAILNKHKRSKRRPIVIYSETVEGNPLNADIVVRYLLNKPGYLGGTSTQEESEIYYVYSDDFLPAGWKAQPLCLPTSDLSLFNPSNRTERKGTYFFANRYLKQGGELFDVTKDSIELSFENKKTLAELAHIFKHAELLYSYERSALCREAMLCGCPVVYLPNSILTEMPSTDLFGTNGAAWGASSEQIEHAKNTVEKIFPAYVELEKIFWHQLDNFISDTQSKAQQREPELDDAFYRVNKNRALDFFLERDPIKIAILTEDLRGHACLSIRLENVLTTLAGYCDYRYILRKYQDEDGEVKEFIDEEAVSWADIVIIQRTAPQKKNSKILETIFKSDSVIVYETDDFLTELLPSSNILHESFRRHIPFIREIVEKADSLTVSTDYLKRQLMPRNKNIFVLPNLIDDRVWQVVKPNEANINKDKITILFAGTVTHRADLESIEDVLMSIYEKYHSKIEFIFAGCTTQRLSSISTLLFDDVVTYATYVEIIQSQQADIVLVPLVDDEFNNSKSNIKWLEYSMSGYCGVYANIEAYNSVIKQGKTGLLASTNEEWYQAIECLILNDDLRFEVASTAQKEVLENYSLSSGSKYYLEAWHQALILHKAKVRERQNIVLPVMPSYEDGYQCWKKRHVLMPADVEILAEKLVIEWHHQPTFHILIAVNEHEFDLLADTIDSLYEQLYAGWGLTIFSRVSKPEIFQSMPENIEWIEIENELNPLINESVTSAGLGWTMQLLPGDRLLPQTFLRFADVINQNSGAHFIYSDEVESELRDSILFKPDFNLELLRSTSYLGRSALIRRDVFETIGGNTGLAYVTVTDLAFNVYELFGSQAIFHLPEVLLIAVDSVYEQQTLLENEISIRVAHFERLGITTRIKTLGQNNLFYAGYLDEIMSKVSIVIVNKNQPCLIWDCIDKLSSMTNLCNHEVIVVDQESDIEDIDYVYEEMKEKLGDKLTIYSYDKANYSAAVNFGVDMAMGDVIVVLSNTASPLQDNWLEVMYNQIVRDDIGVVGARIVDESDETIVHAGGVLGLSDDVYGMFAGKKLRSSGGYMGRAYLRQEYSFVSSACYMVRKENFLAVGGLDEGEFSNTKYAVADFCLKLKQRGLKTVWESQVIIGQQMKYAEDVNSIGVDYISDSEVNLIKKWPIECQNDSSYNRNLSLRHSEFQVERYIHHNWAIANSGRARIMAYPFNREAIGRYRVIEPLNELAHAGLIESCILPSHNNVINIFTPNRFEINRHKPDIIFMHLALSDEFYELLNWIKSETNIFVIFSIDDLVSDVPKNNKNKKRIAKDMRFRLRRILSLCDRAIVSTKPLLDALSEFCKDIKIIPNAMNIQRIEALPKIKRTNIIKPRVGWAGGDFHGGDLAIIIELVKQTANKIDWVFMGMCPEEIRPYIAEFHKFTHYDDYLEKIAGLELDLAIAPLELHPFNVAKSNLKLLDYGAIGLPVICTDIYPYQTDNPPVRRVPNTLEAWTQAVETLINDPDLMKSMGNELHHWVLEHYTLEKHLDAWFTALTKR